MDRCITHLPGTAGQNVNRALGIRRLVVNAVAVFPAVTGVDGMIRLTIGVRQPVVVIDQNRARVKMIVSTQLQIDTVFFEDGIGSFTGYALSTLAIGIMAARTRVRGVMPKRDNPVLRGRGQVAFQPGIHGIAVQIGRGKRIQANKVNIAIVKGIIKLGTGRHST